MELTTVEKRRAGTAIEYTHRDYSKDGGVRDLEAALAKASISCSSHIFGLAQFASKQSKGLPEATERFGEMCLHAEATYKTKHNVENLKDALPVWAVYKSNISRAMRDGFDPADYGSEGELRGAREEETRATGPRLVSSTPELPRPVPVTTVDAGETLLSATTIRPNLQVLLARLMVEAEYIKRGRETEAEKIIEHAVAELSRLVDKRRIKDAATRQALGEVA